MSIPSRQIHNVLNAYSHKLSREVFPGGDGPADRMPISPRWKRQAVVEKLAVEIVDKLIRFRIGAQKRDRTGHHSPAEPAKIDEPVKSGEKSLIYHIIDGNNIKCTREISSVDFCSLFGAADKSKPVERKKTDLTPAGNV